MLTQDKIYDLLRKGEKVTLECKRAGKKLPNSVWETYSAMANTYGGVILLGIDEAKGEKDWRKRYPVEGLADAEKIRVDFWNLLNDTEKVNLNLLIDDDVELVKVEGKDVIAIHVPQADYHQKPVFVNGNMNKGAYKRNHEGDYHCKESELRAMILKVEKRDDGYLFSNPGTLKLPVEEIYRGGVSAARNPHIQDLLRMIGYGDNLGTGFPEMVEVWENAWNEKPVLNERYELQIVELSFGGMKRDEQVVGIDQSNDVENVANDAKNVANDAKNVAKNVANDANNVANDAKNVVNDAKNVAKKVRREAIIQYIKENPEVSRSQIADRFGVSKKTIERDFVVLSDRVQHIGPKKGGRWVIIVAKEEEKDA